MKATIYFHARHEDMLSIKIQASPATGTGTAYYEFHIGDLVLFLDDPQCRQLMDALGSRPDLPKSDAQIDADVEPLNPMPHQERNVAP